MANKNIDALTVRLPAQISAVLRTYLEETTGMTISEALQLCAFRFFEAAKAKLQPTDDVRGEMSELLERRLLAEGSADALASYRHIFGIQEYKKNAGRINYIISVHAGNIVTVYDPNDSDSLSGTLTIGLEDALRILLLSNADLKEKLEAIMIERGTESLLSALTDIINDEYQMQVAQANLPQYAQNQYGLTYSRKKNGVPR